MTVAGITFLRPEALAAIPLAGVIWVVWVLFRRPPYLAVTAVARLEHLRATPSILRRMPWLLVAAACGLIVVALMEPVLPYSESTVHAEGLDIVLVVDLSASMLEAMGNTAGPRREAARLEEMRLEITKRALRHFVRQRRDDRIALVVFSEQAYLIAPLTFDYEYLLHYVTQVDDTLPRSEGKTAIGEGIHLANVLLARQSTSRARNKVIVVFTDGEHNAGRDPLATLESATAAGVRTHLIGVNLEEMVKKKPAVAAFVNAIRRHGGRYFEAGNVRQLEEANRALAALETGRLAGKRFEMNAPIFSWFATTAIVLLVGALGIQGIPFFAEYA